MNKVILIGRLGGDPEKVTGSKNGKDFEFSKFSLATSRTWKDKNGEKQTETQWHNVTAFGTNAINCNKYLKKGGLVMVEGSIAYEQYEKDGEKKYATKILVERFEMLGSKKDDNGSEQAPAPVKSSGNYKQQQEQNNPDDDLPF